MKEIEILERMEKGSNPIEFHKKFGNGLTFHKLRQTIRKVKNPKEIHMTIDEKRRIVDIFRFFNTINLKTKELVTDEDIKEFDELPIIIDDSIKSFKII